MKRLYSALPLSLLLLTGCAAHIHSDVTTFHENVLPAGETIRVVPSDPDKVGSLEFKTYAERIGDELRKVGYTLVTENDVVTELLAEVDYSVEEGQPQIYTDSSHAYARYHFGFGLYRSPFYLGARRGFYDPFYRGFYDPFYDPSWDRPEVYSEPTYNRRLDMNIVKNDGGDLEHIFEGRVESNGRESSLPEVMPYLITAMFANFPGESGVTKLVTIDKDL